MDEELKGILRGYEIIISMYTHKIQKIRKIKLF